MPGTELLAALDDTGALPAMRATEMAPDASTPPPPPPPPPLKTGSTFHGLKVHSVLGEGGMGAAHIVSHPVLRMPLVLKTFKTAAPAQIFREAHLAARVLSPQVVAVLDAGVEDGVAFVVQRYVDGLDLEELLHAMRAIGRLLPVDVVVRVLLDAAKGLQAIHQAGVVHRDVKPANLFLCGDGATMIGDFGIATEALRREEAEPLMGTPSFMAPEQWHQSSVDRRTDLYALGATAHLLATNQTPFHGESAAQLGVKHVTESYRPPTPRNPTEAYLFAVVEGMLRKRPEERYDSAETVATALKVVVESGPRIVPQGDGRARVGDLSIDICVGDISAHEGDVIVSAANWMLVMDRGVAAALKRAGGAEIEAEALLHAPGSMGQVVWTGAGTLKARHVAHAVAALDGAICLQRTTLRALLGAEQRGAASVVMPALGTGVGEVPMALGAKLMFEAFRTFASLRPEHVRSIRVVLFNDEASVQWREVLRSM
jgi:O-acetyl-ADP-ribose deacetylase (regulator of RNase III)